METHTYKKSLELMLEDIIKELNTIGIHNPENPSDWIAVPEEFDAEEPDQNLAADAVEAWDERSGLVAVLEGKYNSIKSALLRIENETFGICEICKNPIEERRLAVSPTARTCMAHLEDESQIVA